MLSRCRRHYIAIVLILSTLLAPRIASADWATIYNTWPNGGKGLDGPVAAMVTWNNHLIVAGTFQDAGNGSGGQIAAHGIASWDGTTWSPMGTGLDGVTTLFVDSQRQLYAAGSKGGIPGSVAPGFIARWHPNASGTGGTWDVPWTFDGAVNALAQYKQAKLVCGGAFTKVALLRPVLANKIAYYDGTTWHPIGVGITGRGQVNSMTTYNNPSGSTNVLIIAGEFLAAGNHAVNGFASWDGSLTLNGFASIQSIELVIHQVLTLSNGVLCALSLGTWQYSPATNKWSLLASSLAGTSGIEYQGQLNEGGPAGLRVYSGGVFAIGPYGQTSDVVAMCEYNTDLYIGGSFTSVGKVQSIMSATPSYNIAAWHGSADASCEWVMTPDTNLGIVAIGGSACAQLTITNMGERDLQGLITTVVSAGVMPSITDCASGMSVGHVSVPSGQSRCLVLCVTPTIAGPFQCKVSYVSNGSPGCSDLVATGVARNATCAACPTLNDAYHNGGGPQVGRIINADKGPVRVTCSTVVQDPDKQTDAALVLGVPGSDDLGRSSMGGTAGLFFPSELGDYATICSKAGSGQTELVLMVQQGANNHIALMPSGCVGIKTDEPTCALDVNGYTRVRQFGHSPFAAAQVYTDAGGILTTKLIVSDAIIKARPMRLDATKVLGLSAEEFTWKDTGQKDFGMVADAVARTVPEVVGRDRNGMVVGIDYEKISALLTEVVKRQEIELKKQSERIERLEEHVEK